MVTVAKRPVRRVRGCVRYPCWRLVMLIGRTGDAIDGYYLVAEAVLVAVILTDNEVKILYIAFDDLGETTVAVMWNVKYFYTIAHH